ncbi:helix-turn-helix transcriptional regulator [Streptomyces sp. NPDC048512]|uniref:helix-turn-helix transcriptional regulator n=1 Tax=unclassified Streptomyces TaxID=2593676 RepID=UPI0009BF139B|nr:helix-turn-helix domain-containing protein [Streptomyces sp. M41(2017)]OQQ13817.1 hypothetical protein B0675_26665 [Streptomyces sp. M41(2017)]
MNEQVGRWDFFTNHARVLAAIAREPASRLRDVAAACDITERTAQNIVNDLDQAGYLHRERDGRRTHYTLHHPAEHQIPLADLLEVLTTSRSHASA